MFCNRNLYSAQENYTVRPLHTPHKSFTAASIALGGAASRTVTDAVKNGSQIADRFSITWFSGKQKRTRFQCFLISWKQLKPSSKLCILFFVDKTNICLYFDFWGAHKPPLWGFNSLNNANNLSDIGIYSAKKSNRVFRTKHFALMRKFRTRSRPAFNHRNRLFQA